MQLMFFKLLCSVRSILPPCHCKGVHSKDETFNLVVRMETIRWLWYFQHFMAGPTTSLKKSHGSVPVCLRTSRPYSLLPQPLSAFPLPLVVHLSIWHVNTLYLWIQIPTFPLNFDLADQARQQLWLVIWRFWLTFLDPCVTLVTSLECQKKISTPNFLHSPNRTSPVLKWDICDRLWQKLKLKKKRQKKFLIWNFLC